jgi:hypothetical protein
MIAPEAGLSVSRQCFLLGVARSSFYYRPRLESAAELDLLKRLDRFSPTIRSTAAAGCRWRSCEREFRSAAAASGG